MALRTHLAPLHRVRPLPADPTFKDRMTAKVDRSGGPDACWTWTGARHRGGYGVLHTGGKCGRTVYAHRVSWMLHTGTDPANMAVCHRCDNPPCCNPRHLFLGTIADNVRDMIDKGRARTAARPPHLRGEAHGSAKITEANVIEIRQRSAMGEPSPTIAASFGIDPSTVRQIIRRVIWRHVP